jgi:hypothetical protein
MNDRWAVYRSGDVTINWVEGDGGGKTQQFTTFILQPRANSRPGAAIFAPNTTINSSAVRYSIFYEWRMKGNAK